MKIASRRAVIASLLGASALCVRRGTARVFHLGLSEGEELLHGRVTVPADFTGMHAHRWPVGVPTAPAPAYAFGTARSHDFDGAAWYHIHIAPGRYDWERLDRWVDAHSAARRTLVYTLYGTPAWLATTTERKDLYGQPGGAAPPRDMQPLGEFVQALMHRYNSEGRQRLSVLETWNEPHFNNDPEDFWWGTAEQLVVVGRTCHKAAKVVDPSIRILSPGFVGDLSGAFSLQLPMLAAAQRSSLYQYLTASDGVGGTGSRWCDGIAFHSYNVPLEGEDLGYLKNIRRLQGLLRHMNVGLPLYNTEMGFLSPHPFRVLPAIQQAQWLRRTAVLQAALGVQSMYFYAHDDDLIGNPSLHPEVAQAIGDIHAMLSGKTLTGVTLLPGGSVEVATTEQRFHW